MKLAFTVVLALGLSKPCAALNQKASKHSRIVSTSVAADEILWELLPPQERHRVIAFSELANNGRYSALGSLTTKVPTVRSAADSILRLTPSLVILSHYNRPELKEQLRRLKVVHFELPAPKGIGEIPQQISKLSKLIERDHTGSLLAQTMLTQINAALKSSTHKKKKSRILIYGGEPTYPGSQTLLNEVINLAGGDNALNRLNIMGWKTLSDEQMLRLQPDIIVVPNHLGNRKNILHQLRNSMATKNWRAVKKQKIVVIPTHLLYSNSHHLMRTVAILQKEIFRYAP